MTADGLGQRCGKISITACQCLGAAGMLVMQLEVELQVTMKPMQLVAKELAQCCPTHDRDDFKWPICAR